MGAGGETFPVSVPWALVLGSILNDFWEVGARASYFFKSGHLGWPPLRCMLLVHKAGLGLRPKLTCCVDSVHQPVASLYQGSFGDGGRCLGEVYRCSCTSPLQRFKGGATRQLYTHSIRCWKAGEEGGQLCAWYWLHGSMCISLMTLGSLSNVLPHYPEVASICWEGGQHGYQASLREWVVSKSWDESRLHICQGGWGRVELL